MTERKGIVKKEREENKLGREPAHLEQPGMNGD